MIISSTSAQSSRPSPPPCTAGGGAWDGETALVKDELFGLKIFDVFFFLSSSNALEMIAEQEVIAQ